MAESRTAKKSHKKNRRKKEHHSNDLYQLEIATDLAVAYIKVWARNQALDSLYSNTPIIVPAGNGYRVGRFAVKSNPNATWAVHNHLGEKISDFAWKSSAVAYCLLEHTRRFQLSREIMALDHHMLKLEVDLAFYKKSMENSLKKKDTVKSEFVWNRYLQAKAQFDAVRNNLEKSLKSTKYLKVWDPKS